MKIKFILPMLALAGMLFIAAPVQAGDRVNINSATVEQLQSVKGIGSKRAAAIVAYRSKHGSFKSVDELENVKGIGEKSLKKIEDELTTGQSD
ncbi:MAG: helix-hairpin-helix domain-containing protein [Mariprofundaceae bacterium]|nr:helix-hairpin-helix domain-containing protein [Mariprofundaceae bacterium]